jgi:hypothetical protein
MSGIVEVILLKLFGGVGRELSKITAGDPDSSLEAENSFITALAVIL